jgi:hypothetical protein
MFLIFIILKYTNEKFNIQIPLKNFSSEGRIRTYKNIPILLFIGTFSRLNSRRVSISPPHFKKF